MMNLFSGIFLKVLIILLLRLGFSLSKKSLLKLKSYFNLNPSNFILFNFIVSNLV